MLACFDCCLSGILKTSTMTALDGDVSEHAGRKKECSEMFCMLSTPLSLLTGCFLFYLKPFSVNLRGGWVVVKIPADQQFVKYSHQLVWHQQPRSPHLNSLQSPFSRVCFFYSCKSSLPCLQALSCCHGIFWLVDCIKELNTFSSDVTSRCTAGNVWCICPHWIIQVYRAFVWTLQSSDTYMCCPGMCSRTNCGKCFILWCESTLPGSWIEVWWSRGTFGFSGVVVKVAAFRSQPWSTDICTTARPMFVFPPFGKCLDLTSLLLFSHFSGNNLSGGCLSMQFSRNAHGNYS